MDNYEQKYKDALEKLQEALAPTEDGCKISGLTRGCIENIFPELKESEDEHKKWILEYLYDGLRRTDEQFKDEFKAAIAWFEKQCEKESDPRYEELEDLLEADTIYQMAMNDAMVEEAKSKAVNALSNLQISKLLGLEKQGEQKPYGQRKECEDCQINYAGECKGFCQMKRDEQKTVNNVEPKFHEGDIVQYITDSTDRRKIEEIDTLCNMYHTDSSPIMFDVENEWKVVVNAEDVEQESVDKVEPKFKVGDWVVLPLGIVAHIDSLNSTDYQVTTTDGKICDFKISKQDNYRLWAIQDAKDGDVLYSIDSKQPFIYKERPQFSQARGYCCINKFGEFAIWNTSKCVICTDKYIPATKEQRDTLIKAMANAGYTFDFEKKELNKIEVKTLDPDKVIEWLSINYSLFEGDIVEQFKEDFGL